MSLNLYNTSKLELTEPSVHKLVKKAYWQWWQVSQALSLVPKKEPDPLRNEALRACVLFLLTSPFSLGIMLYCALPTLTQTQEGPLLKALMIFVSAWSVMLTLFLLSFRKHQRIVQEVAASNTGLEFKSAFLKEKLQWFEIEDIYQFIDAGNGLTLYKVECKNNRWFLLSSDLTDIEKLLGLIEANRAHLSKEVYALNYRISDSYFDCANMAMAAVFIAVTAFLVNQVKMPQGAELIMITILYLVLAAIYWLHKEKIPQMIRLGKTGICLQTHKRNHHINWEQITKTQKFGPVLLLKSRSDWFMLNFIKKEICERLLVYKKDLIGH